MSRNVSHQWLLKFDPDVKRIFDSLPRNQKQGIFRRLRELLNANDPYTLPFVEMLKADKFERSRKFRVGDYRVFFIVEPVEVINLGHTYKGSLFLIDIRNRKSAY